MRSEVCEDSLQVSLLDVRREEPPPAPSVSTSDRVFNSPDQCQYWLCDFTSPSESVMNRHIVDAHTIDSNFTYPRSNVKTICGYDMSTVQPLYDVKVWLIKAGRHRSSDVFKALALLHANAKCSCMKRG